ncbi:trifunctional purine biosynthetic protein adenosine-3-related [Holotrichia oblita]|nr:trifunctional purine biosynthetic protein adenosine-3-related [Holotrichia oblita]
MYEGKAKKVWATTDSSLVVVEYKDDATAFNGLKKGTISGKGVVNNLMSNHMFRLLSQNGIETHYAEELSDRETVVKKVQIVPLEVIIRNRAAGSMAKRLGLTEGSALKCTVLEFSYKDDSLGDPMINDYHALAMGISTKEEIAEISRMAFKINDVMKAYFKKLNVDLIDFKLEFGRFEGRIILADEISPDTCRFWDSDTGEKLDKDRFRRDMGGVEEAYAEMTRRLAEENEVMAIDYKNAGVNIENGYRAVELIKKHTKRTFDKNVLLDLGGFGGLYSIEDQKIDKPVLVSGTDGVGTKLKYAFLTGRHDTIGIDCVAMCANDVVCQGAKPLFFLDYFATGKLEPEVAATVVGGIADGCVMAGCALIGGETAEMPGFYPAGEYDLAGFCVGIAGKDSVITGSDITAGDVLIGLASSGIHSNGFSLVRKLFGEDAEILKKYNERLKKTLADEVLTPTRIYVKTILSLMNKFKLKGIAHITGGGFIENIPRIFPDGVGGQIDVNSFPMPEVFKLLAEKSGAEKEKLYNTFNMGIGMVLCVSAADASAVVKAAEALGEKAPKPKRLLILISGGGSNMQAVFDAIDGGRLNAEVAAVVSSNHEAGGLNRAAMRNLPTYVCPLNEYSSREQRDGVILEIARKTNAEYILTLGYLGICSKVLTDVFTKRIINIHPALLPKFGGKGFFGLNVHKAVLESGETVSGATVHFADEGTDTGEIIMSKQVAVLKGDTPESLQRRVLEIEHILLIDALNFVFKS